MPINQGPFLLITTEILKDIDGTLNTIIKSPSKATKAINHYIDIEHKKANIEPFNTTELLNECLDSGLVKTTVANHIALTTIAHANS